MMHQVAEVPDIKEVLREFHGWHPVREEVFEAAGLHSVHVVVEVEEALGKARYPVKEHLYHGAVERGQMLLGHDVLVKHHVHRFPVHPLGHLAFPCNHKMDAVDEGHELIQPAEMVLESAPVAEALVQDLLSYLAFIIHLPERVQPVYIRYYRIHNYLIFKYSVICRGMSV